MSGIILLTGGLGYLGGRIAQRLAASPEWLPRVATRRDVREVPPWLSRGEIAFMPAGRPDAWAGALQSVSAIIHLAGANEIDAKRDPVGALDTTAAETHRLIEVAAAAGVPRLLYMSTAHVYGSPLVGTITEDTPARPVHPYAITHRCAEDFVLAARAEGRLDGLVVRLSNGIGAPAHADVNRWTLAGNDFCRQAVETGRITLRSRGTQWRDFVTLSDAGDAIALLLKANWKGIADGILNLGGDLPLRIIDVAERVQARAAAVLGATPPIVRPESGPEHEPRIDFRIDRLRALGYVPRRDLDSEIDETLRLCRDSFARQQS